MGGEGRGVAFFLTRKCLHDRHVTVNISAFLPGRMDRCQKAQTGHPNHQPCISAIERSAIVLDSLLERLAALDLDFILPKLTSTHGVEFCKILTHMMMDFWCR